MGGKEERGERRAGKRGGGSRVGCCIGWGEEVKEEARMRGGYRRERRKKV